jgi:hypothetical protein
MDTDGITFTRPVGMSQDDFYAACERVRSWFTPLSPYQGQPPILEQEDENLWENRREPLSFIGVSSKRYVLYNLVPNPDGPILRDGERYYVRLRSFTVHGTGTYAHLDGYQSPPHIPEPCEPVSQLGGPRWLYDLWYDFVVAIERHYTGHHPLPTNADGAPRYALGTRLEDGANPALCVPAFHQVTLSTWHLLHQYSADYGGPLEGVRPFSFFTVVPGFVGGADFRQPASKAARLFRLMLDYDGAIPAHIAAAYEEVPTNTPFIGPKVNTPAEFRSCVERGEFGWWKDGEWHVLPPEVETPTIAEVFADYFQHPEAKRACPRSVGQLAVPAVKRIDRQEIIGKEVDRLASSTFAGVTDGAVPQDEVVQWLPYGDDTDWMQILSSYRLRDLMLATGLPQRTLSDLRSGKTVAPEESTLTALRMGLKLLAPDNPDNILGWADIPYSYFASVMGWELSENAAVSCGKRGLTPEERERFITAIREWKRSLEENDTEHEAMARRFVTALLDQEVAS